MPAFFMKIENRKVKDLIPYVNNPRKNDKAVDAVANSIKEFGFRVPIVVDRDGVVITGHTRLKACLKLGIKEVPCVIADDLTEDQVRAYRIADNSVAEIAEWDLDLLDIELGDIEFDMEDFGLNLGEKVYEREKTKEEIAQRTYHILNYDKGIFDTEGQYDIPVIKPIKEIAPIKEWIGFNFVLSDKNPQGKGVHFFIDDYQFERVWSNPDKYIDKLMQYEAVCSPDFSPFMDMPFACQLFNHYRKHWVARYWQEMGVKIIPTIRASADERSLEWYLDGEPHNGIVCISNMWTNDKESKDYFLNKEYRYMVERLNPTKVFVYGAKMKELTDVEYIETFSQKSGWNG